MTKTTTTLALAALALAAPAFAQAPQTVYDNSVGFTGQMTNEGNREVGDEVRISNPSLNIVDSFEFEYNYIRNAGDGTVTAQIRFYSMSEIEPGVFVPSNEAFAVSPLFTLTEGPGHRVWRGAGGAEDPLNIVIPDHMTWSVSFGSLDGGEQAGLLFYGAPEVGTSNDDFWRRDAQWDTWRLFDTAGVQDSFAARIVAVPEPSTFALLGGAALLMGLRRRKA